MKTVIVASLTALLLALIGCTDKTGEAAHPAAPGADDGVQQMAVPAYKGTSPTQLQKQGFTQYPTALQKVPYQQPIPSALLPSGSGPAESSESESSAGESTAAPAPSSGTGGSTTSSSTPPADDGADAPASAPLPTESGAAESVEESSAESSGEFSGH